MEKYSLDKVCTKEATGKDDNINSLIMEFASDIAEKLTNLECQLNSIVELVKHEDDSTSYTEEAQDIFNEYYDEQVDSLYKLVNLTINTDAPTEEEKIIYRLEQFISGEEDAEISFKVLKDAVARGDGNEMVDHYIQVCESQEYNYTINRLLGEIGYKKQ